jgi:hypothetical protein
MAAFRIVASDLILIGSLEPVLAGLEAAGWEPPQPVIEKIITKQSKITVSFLIIFLIPSSYRDIFCSPVQRRFSYHLPMLLIRPNSKANTSLKHSYIGIVRVCY